MRIGFAYALILALLLSFNVHAAPSPVDDDGPEIITNAYFFALEDGNYSGAFWLYSDQYKARYADAKEWELKLKALMPQTANHISRVMQRVTVANGRAKVRVMIVDQAKEVWGYIINLEIQGGLWRIVGTSAINLGVAKPEM